MVITSYYELSTFGKILFASYKAGKTQDSTVDAANTQGKITQEEYNFILGAGA